jgi:RND family efflux transporter MFP subunit
MNRITIPRALALVIVSLSLLTLLIAAGCSSDATAQVAAAAPSQVSVAQVVSRPIMEYDEFTGRIEAIERVELRPRVSGYIAAVQFAEGAEVRKGDVLFVIDPRPYDATLRRARAELARAVSARALAASERARATRLLELRALSQEEFDARSTSSEQSVAAVQVAQAAVDSAALDLEFTRVRAPIAGIVGRAAITAGNVVKDGETLLATLVSIDPVYVQFQGDEQTFLKYATRTRQSGKGPAQQPAWIGVADETGHPHEGRLVFMDNELDAATGTIRVRARLDNAERRFTPGMFARVRLAGSGEYEALLIKDSAVGVDQGRRYVYVVDRDNKVQYRAVKLGPVFDGLRVVREGLSPGEAIVVNGLQRVRPGAPVMPQAVAMAPTRAEGVDSKVLLARAGAARP